MHFQEIGQKIVDAMLDMNSFFSSRACYDKQFYFRKGL
jgi:hypothetical protein